MEFVDQIWTYLEPVWAWLMTGLESSSHSDGASINWLMLGVQMGVIALVMALLMPSYGAILIFTVASVIVHVVVDQVLPMVQSGADFAIPAVTEMVYWQYIAFAGLAYLVGLTVLFIIKSIVLPR
jgi:membrane-bound ClpP family serine protease